MDGRQTRGAGRVSLSEPEVFTSTITVFLFSGGTFFLAEFVFLLTVT